MSIPFVVLFPVFVLGYLGASDIKLLMIIGFCCGPFNVLNCMFFSFVVGDYQVSDDVVIERKTAKDFVDSIVDKRLFKQVTQLREEFKKPIIILEGDDLYNGYINPNAIRGTIVSIALDFGISIIPTRDSQDTAAMIKRIAVREQKGEKTPISIRTDIF